MNRTIKFSMMFLAMAAMWACTTGTDPIVEDPIGTIDPGVAPTIQLEVPSVLTDDGTTVAKTLDANMGSMGGNARSLFNPFRRSLHFTNHMIRRINNTLGRINEHNIPADTTRIMASGDSMVVSTDTTAAYTKHIEIFSADGLKYLELNYNEGENKIYAVFKPDNRNSDSGVDWIDVLYDATGDSPTMTSSLILGGADQTSMRHRHGQKLYVELTGTTNGVNLQGGVVYDYEYGRGDAEGNPTSYTGEHTYMYQAVIDTVNPGALVNLYFPPSTVATLPLPRANYGEDILDVVHTWVNYTENTQIQSRLQFVIDLVPDSSFSYVTPEGLMDIFTYITEMSTQNTGLDALVDYMSLTNPIAFNPTEGYVAHGDSVDASFLSIGDPSTVTFSKTPAEIAALVVSFILP